MIIKLFQTVLNKKEGTIKGISSIVAISHELASSANCGFAVVSTHHIFLNPLELRNNLSAVLQAVNICRLNL